MNSSSKIYRKVAGLAAFDGWGLVLFGTISLIFGLIYWDASGWILGAGLTTLGAIELQGRRLWLAGKPRASGWLAGSQLGTLLLLVSYAARCYFHPPIWRVDELSPEMQQLLEAMPNYDVELINDMLPTMLRISYLILIIVVLSYQGGLTLYYLQAERRLGEKPPLPVG